MGFSSPCGFRRRPHPRLGEVTVDAIVTDPPYKRASSDATSTLHRWRRRSVARRWRLRRLPQASRYSSRNSTRTSGCSDFSTPAYAFRTRIGAFCLMAALARTSVDAARSFRRDLATYDFSTTDVKDNVRVPLIDDQRLSKALKLFAQRTALLNGVPALGEIVLSWNTAKRLLKIELEAGMLMSELVAPTARRGGLRMNAQADSGTRTKIERNDPCPCGSGSKFKRCCGK